MSDYAFNRCSRFIACSMILLLCPAALGQTQNVTNAPLSLSEAEHLALGQDPVTKQREAQAQAFSERAVADGQLPDPQLSLGLGDVPSNFKVDEDPDTELQLGLSQAFRAGARCATKASRRTRWRKPRMGVPKTSAGRC